MPAIDKSILIDAPPEEVFAFVADPRNTIRYQRHFTRFDPIGEPTHGLGAIADARGWFHGVPVRSRLRVVQFVPDSLISSRSIAGLKNQSEWRFHPEDGKTRARFSVRFEWPVPVLSRLLRKAMETELDRMTDSALRELKRLVESARVSQAHREA